MNVTKRGNIFFIKWGCQKIAENKGSGKRSSEFEHSQGLSGDGDTVIRSYTSKCRKG